MYRAFQPYIILVYPRKQKFEKFLASDQKEAQNHDICLPQNGIGPQWMALAQYSIYFITFYHHMWYLGFKMSGHNGRTD